MEIVTVKAQYRNNKTGKLETREVLTDGESAFIVRGDAIKPIKPPYTVTVKISVRDTIIAHSWRVDG